MNNFFFVANSQIIINCMLSEIKKKKTSGEVIKRRDEKSNAHDGDIPDPDEVVYSNIQRNAYML